MRKSGSVYIIILLCMILLILAVALLTGGTNSAAPAPTQSTLGSASLPGSSPTLSPAATPTPAAATPPPAASAPPAVTAPVPSPSVPSSVAPSPAVPQTDPAEAGYFSDAVFIGNSLVDGLYLYGGVDECDFLSGTGVSIYNFSSQKISDKKGSEGTILDFLGKKQYGKIYILLGINEIGGAVDTFITSYAATLNEIKALQPNAQFYVLSLTPVSEEKSQTSEYFTKANVQKYNEALCAMCSDNGYNYIDCFTPLADENGFLPADCASDGIHFSVDFYPTWMDVIKTHHI